MALLCKYGYKFSLVFNASNAAGARLSSSLVFACSGIVSFSSFAWDDTAGGMVVVRTGVFGRLIAVTCGAGGDFFSTWPFSLKGVFVVEGTFGWSRRIMLLMSASDCELCGSPIVTRRIFPLVALASVHGVRGLMFDFFGVFLLDRLDGGVTDSSLGELLIAGSSKKEGRFATDNDFRSDDCNGERRIPSNSSFGIVGTVARRKDGMEAVCS
jgi:hypothetical protein